MKFTVNVPNRSKTRWNLKKAILVLATLILIFFAILIIRTITIYERDLPSFESLHNIEPSLKTKIYASDNTILQEYFSENRTLTPFGGLPTHLVDMVIAVEDRDFYDHWGLNPRRVFIVALKNITKMKIEAGASTITMQLARMLFLTRERTMERKFKEALTAIKLERTYAKEEILEMYLNQYYFHRAYGISSAARVFFDKSITELSISDCAVLLGMLRGPVINSPFNNPDKALQARNRVLYAYYTSGGISREALDSLRAEPLMISPPEKELGKAPYFTEIVRQHILEKYGEKALYSGGLKVYSTIDVNLQEVADQSIEAKLDSIQARIERVYAYNHPTYTYIVPDTVDSMGDSVYAYKQIQAAAAVINNENGDILAMVGGKSFTETKFNRATQSLLQPGSSFKPFVYTAAIDNGYHPSDIFYDNSIKLEIPGAKDWRPHNFDNKFMGEMTLRTGLALSRNLIAIKLLLKIHPEQAIFYAHKMGIRTPLNPVASLAIGTELVRLVELTSAYTVFPNGGIQVPYRYIIRIEDRYGNVLEDNSLIQKAEVLSAQTAYIMTTMLQSVADHPKGTGRGMRWRGFTRPAGGKTGTSDNFCDNWFVGFTPQVTTGVWVGFDEKLSIGKNQTGGRNALPIWTKIMLAAHDTIPITDFEIPEGIETAVICLESGQLATDRCLATQKEVFRIEELPHEACPLHPSKGMFIDPSIKTDDYNLPEDTSDVVRF